MDFLLNALTSTAVICWLTGQLLSVLLDLLERLRNLRILERLMRILRSAIYIASIVFLVRFGVLEGWLLFFFTLSLMIVLNASFGTVRRLLAKRKNKIEA